MSNIGFKDAHFATTGANMYYKTARAFPRTRTGNPNGEICLVNNGDFSGSAAWPSYEGAIWTYNATFANAMVEEKFGKYFGYLH